MSNRLWTSDFVLEDGAVRVKKTGHLIALDLKLWHSIFTWFCFYSLAQGWRIWRRLQGHKRPSIAFAPDKPRPWYLIWPVMHASGVRLVDDPMDADIVMHFDDSTTSVPGRPAMRPGARAVNFDCSDISKSNVAHAFDRVAGYSLSVDPTAWTGPVVDKSEVNAAHDGRIVQGPFEPQPGRSYQRLIDNEIPGGLVEDLRTVTIGGEPVIVFRKHRPLERRFANENVSCDWVRPADVFTPAEIDLIRRFTSEIRLDWGGVDVLRNSQDGRIYIVDANKTDMGPPIALPLGQKLRATRLLARTFVTAFAP
ncbi:hypothetical protein GC169_03335 [bacterium]|nr:hypothetical protein [bacterium]